MSVTNLSLAVDDGADEDSAEENEDSNLDDDDDTDSSVDAGGVTFITNHDAEIQQLDVDNEEDGDDDVIVVSEEGERCEIKLKTSLIVEQAVMHVTRLNLYWGVIMSPVHMVVLLIWLSYFS